MFGAFVQRIKGNPEITPLVILLSGVSGFAVYSLYERLTTAPDVALDHRTPNWKRNGVDSAKN
eukprot:m.36181 g.36181  ORF g.36181 m.36181 type:complete len:63 (+) comp9969_c0_seq1:231-419(+)